MFLYNLRMWNFFSTQYLYKVCIDKNSIAGSWKRSANIYLLDISMMGGVYGNNEVLIPYQNIGIQF